MLQHVHYIGQHLLFLEVDQLIDEEAVWRQLRDPVLEGLDNYVLRDKVLSVPRIVEITVYLVEEGASKSLLTLRM